jgi:choline dehydrogenase
MYTAESSPSTSDMVMTIFSVPETPASPAKVTIAGQLCHETSVGELFFPSAEVASGPIMRFNYLDEETDRRRLREAVRLGLELADFQTMRKVVGEPENISAPDMGSESSLDSWVARHIATTHHSVGTCKLGSEADVMAVTDDNCRVRGVEGLRVVDLSIAPRVPRAHTFATAVMIGERASELIMAT